jgi:ornithine cyclodeaminase
VLILGAAAVRELLRGRETEVVDAVRAAYVAHAGGLSSLPHSAFLRLPGGADRIIALPAYLGGPSPRAGVKWIASFPGNGRLGLDRASAVVVLNSTETGRAEAVLEGSAISAQRTAASAALAASALRPAGDVSTVGIIGCGVINHEVLRFLRLTLPGISAVRVYDRDPSRAVRFVERALDLDGSVVGDPYAVLTTAPVVSIATTAQQPHLRDLPAGAAHPLVLHLSLRDFSPEVMLAQDNYVDDVDHACREGTSLQLAEQAVGHRDFIQGTLADVLLGTRTPAADPSGRRWTLFSPFGLGILDLAVASLVADHARRQRVGLEFDDFHAPPDA